MKNAGARVGGTRMLLGAMLAFVSSMSWADCYSIYGAGGELVYQSTSVPINLGNRIGDEVPRVWGVDARLVFTPNSSDCQLVGVETTTDVMSGPLWAYMEAGLSPSGRVVLPSSMTDGETWSAMGGRSSSGGSHLIQTGPRGGQFYENPNGNKTYVPRR